AFPKRSGGFQLKSSTRSIGSHRGADIVLQAAGVADRHVALEFSASDNSFILQDFNSPHGTFVNSCQVQNAAVRVRPGDILSFGTAGAGGGWGCPGRGGDVQGKVPREGWVGMSRERYAGEVGRW
ncbi:FHAD1 protein, partial [Erythrocercus mccallii]|nr:FHAD1 protein [Erythrocercus mccallii]